ncbi:DHH family phosphoesterase [Marinicrinis sediminis]|uniref:Bifunctional oligoribonuclease/PAP phosphatase NrnA n=1 Tax=Marinicrinis sediminis TaxID=1652465 RepID=A0ABW5R5M8_9BACL
MSGPSLTSSYSAQFSEAAQFMQQHDSFLVVSHIHPDGDAASSTCAVGLMLDQLGKRYTLLNDGAVPQKFDEVCGSDRIVNAQLLSELPAAQAIIAVDCADFERIGEVAARFPAGLPLLNIDHHPTNDLYGTANLVIADASATAEILYDLITFMSLSWNKQLADCIYTGLLTDTGGFRYANTSSKVMKMAATLLDYGTSASELAEILLESTTSAHVELLKRALNTLTFSPKQDIAWVIVEKEDMSETKANHEDLEGIVNYPRNIEGVQVGMLFKEMKDGTVKCSFRSAGKANVAALAQQFGGGGHVRAAGATLDGPLSEAIASVVREVERALYG